MFETVTLGTLLIAFIIASSIPFLLLVYIGIRLDMLYKHVKKQQDATDLKNQIIADIKKTS